MAYNDDADMTIGAPAFARGALDAVAAKRGMARSQASD